MLCPYCGHDETRVIDSRASAENAIRRRRECLRCRRRITTYEKAEQSPLKVIKRDGSRSLFDREKVRSGILRACHKRPVEPEKVDRIVADIEADVFDSFEYEVPSREIRERVSAALQELDEVAYLRFASVYREFPSDFDESRRAAARDRNALRVYLDPGDAPPELIAEFYVALAALHRACGGAGLEVIKEERRQMIGEVL